MKKIALVLLLMVSFTYDFRAETVPEYSIPSAPFSVVLVLKKTLPFIPVVATLLGVIFYKVVTQK